MKKTKFHFAFLLVGGLLLSACQLLPTQTPPVGDGFELGQEAGVESLDVMLLESFPLQAQVRVSGYTPDGCTSLEEISVERQDQVFTLTLTTRRLTGDIACTEALVPFEETVGLEIAGLEAGTYSVIAQDQETQFTLDVDNVLPEAEEDGAFDYGQNAVVEAMTLNIMESFPVQVSVMLEGYLPDGCTQLYEVNASREGDTFTIETITRRPSGDVMCTMALVPFEETVSLDVVSLPAGEYTVRAGDLSETFIFDVDNE